MNFNYGGQALIEGVLIRGRRGIAVAIRAPDGTIVSHTEYLDAGSFAALRRIPGLRGVFALWETLTIGTRMLIFSAGVASGQSGQSDSPPTAVTGTVVATVGAAVALFFIAPLVAMNRATRRMKSPLAANALESMVRLGLFIGYIGAVSQVRDIRRVFAYHGAEHKAVHAYEHEVPLDVAEVQRFPTAHPRCGTAFLLQVMVLSALVFSLFGRPSLARRVALRIVMVPVLSSISYELLRLGARTGTTPLTRILVGPGLALQRLTTREPDDDQVEVAIAAMQAAIELDADAR